MIQTICIKVFITSKLLCSDFHHFDRFCRKKASFQIFVLRVPTSLVCSCLAKWVSDSDLLLAYSVFFLLQGTDGNYTSEMSEQYTHAGCNTYYIDQHPGSTKDLMSCKEQGIWPHTKTKIRLITTSNFLK